MKKIICKKEYDTETAELYEESLYQTSAGTYFLYVNGGENSPYPKEDIKRLSKDKAEEWLAKH